MSESGGTTFWLPEAVVRIVDSVKQARRDTRRSDTIKFLLILGLNAIGALDEETRRVHGLKLKETELEALEVSQA